MSAIPNNYSKLMDNLLDVEGGRLHKNSTEIDVTNRYGIYRGSRAGRNFKPLWDYVDKVASKVTKLPSSKWTNEISSEVNNLLDPDKVRYLSYLFYKDYFAGAHLDLFHNDLVILMANLYTNSPKGAWMSVQEALRDIQRDGILNMPFKKLSIADGVFGDKTRKALLEFLKTADRKDIIIFKKSILLSMKSYYIDLAVGNPDKFLLYLNGWDNRMEEADATIKIS